LPIPIGIEGRRSLSELPFRLCCDMSTKFCLQTDFDIRKRVTSPNTKSEVVLSYRCRHLEIVHNVITSAAVGGGDLVA